MSGLLTVSTSFSLPDSINLQDLLVTEHPSNPKNPDFKGEEHTWTLKPEFNEVYPNCTSKRMFQKRWSLSRFLVHDSIEAFMNSPLFYFIFPYYSEELSLSENELIILLQIANIFPEDQ